ncbi:hypothetical protein BRD00_09265 [Halobacteriales archaeon QS_8_69_26]|nr:MAG: hypothetical protein BRD00_09265 [Halobacteriales archaeon QS_8_69_26]
MDRTSRGAALVAVLGVVALAAAAAGIPVATPSDEGGSGAPDPGADAPSTSPVAPNLGAVPAAVSAAVVLVALGVLVWTLLQGNPRSDVAALVVAVALFVGLAALFDLLFRGGVAPAGGIGPEPPGAVADGGTGGDGGGGGLAVPPLALAVAALVALALPAALFALGHDREEGEGPPGDADPDPRAAMARAAGRAADRIEGGERALDNEVYRCWREMTRGLDPTNPTATTPAEFEGTAVDRGVDPDHARELTALFERVRYGGRSPTEGDEHRAVELLRRIEAAYGDDAAGQGGDGDSDRERGPDPDEPPSAPGGEDG